MKQVTRFPFLLAMLWLTACGSVEPAPSFTPTAVSRQVTTTTSLPLNTATPTPAPATKTPTAVNSPTPTARDTIPIPTSSPNSTPAKAKPVFLYTQGGTVFRFDLATLQAQPLPLLRAQGEIRAATLRPDGRFLAYSDETGLQLWDMSSNQTQPWLAASTEPWEQFRPRSWSSAGYLLLQRTWGTENTTPVWTQAGDTRWHPLPMPATGTAETYGLDSGAAWSPDGTLLALAGYDYGIPSNVPGLSVVDVAAGEARRIVTETVSWGVGASQQIVAGVYNPAWSPDGEWIAFGMNGEPIGPLQFPTRLHRVRPDGSDLTRLTDNARGRATWPVWAGDGRLYYSLSQSGDEDDGIYIYDPWAQTHSLLIAGPDLCPLALSPQEDFLIYSEGCGFSDPIALEALKVWAVDTGESFLVSTGQDGAPVEFVGWQTAAAQPPSSNR